MSEVKTGQITDFGAWLAAQANSYIIKPITAKGIGGFVFDLRDDERAELRSEITDYVMEDNSVAQDHIALKAPTITLRGFIGEVSQTITSPVPASAALQNKLTDLSTYLPQYSTGGLLALSNAVSQAGSALQEINQAVDRAQNLVSLITRSPLGTAQQNAFAALKAMWQSKQVVTVETPWEYFDNMAIQNVIFEQDNKSEMYSDVIVTLKQLRFATLQIQTSDLAGRAKEMFAPLVSKQIKGDEIDPLSPPWNNATKGIQTAVLSFMGVQ